MIPAWLVWAVGGSRPRAHFPIAAGFGVWRRPPCSAPPLGRRLWRRRRSSRHEQHPPSMGWEGGRMWRRRRRRTMNHRVPRGGGRRGKGGRVRCAAELEAGGDSGRRRRWWWWENRGGKGRMRGAHNTILAPPRERRGRSGILSSCLWRRRPISPLQVRKRGRRATLFSSFFL